MRYRLMLIAPDRSLRSQQVIHAPRTADAINEALTLIKTAPRGRNKTVMLIDIYAMSGPDAFGVYIGHVTRDAGWLPKETMTGRRRQIDNAPRT
jgi:hypothetical protein